MTRNSLSLDGVMTNSTEGVLCGEGGTRSGRLFFASEGIDARKFLEMEGRTHGVSHRRKKDVLYRVITEDNEDRVMTGDQISPTDRVYGVVDSEDGHATRVWRRAYGEVKKGRSRMDIGKVRECADAYKRLMNRKRLVFKHVHHNEDGSKTQMMKFVRPVHMLDENYWKRHLVRLDRIESWWGMGITLTLRASPVGSVYDDILKVKRCWNVMRGYLSRHPYIRGRSGDPGRFDYFAVVEVGSENRMVHLHVLVFGASPPGCGERSWWCRHDHLHEIEGVGNAFRCLHRDISDKWLDITGDSKVVWLSSSSVQAKNYVLKYLTKGVRGGELSDSLYLVWASGRRVWSCSRGLLDILSGYDELPDDVATLDRWVFLGVYEIESASDLELLDAEITLLHAPVPSSPPDPPWVRRDVPQNVCD